MAGEDYPGINIGPEPTTDKFTIILHGKERKVITGNSLVMHKKLPFRSLQKFGNTFLSRLQCSLVDSNMLNGLSLVDTPGMIFLDNSVSLNANTNTENLTHNKP